MKVSESALQNNTTQRHNQETSPPQRLDPLLARARLLRLNKSCLLRNRVRYFDRNLVTASPNIFGALSCVEKGPHGETG